MLHKLHRYMGLISFVALFWLAISGLFLNHTQTFKLSERRIDNAFVAKFYGIHKLMFTQAIRLGGEWIFGINNDIYWGDKKIPAKHDAAFVSAIQKDNLVIIATKKELLILTQAGEYIDNLGIKNEIQKLGLDGRHNVVVETKDNCLTINQEYTASAHCSEGGQVWVQPHALADEFKDRFKEKWQNGISLERILLDAHSGRILGIMGVYLIDIVAIFMVVIGFSGFLIWLKTKAGS